MSEEMDVSCARPIRGSVVSPLAEKAENEIKTTEKEMKTIIKVGELIRQIQAFQYVRESKEAEATPAGWRPGKKTLKPGPDLVGKVYNVWKPD